jgi:hypothetical protein
LENGAAISKSGLNDDQQAELWFFLGQSYESIAIKNKSAPDYEKAWDAYSESLKTSGNSGKAKLAKDAANNLVKTGKVKGKNLLSYVNSSERLLHKMMAEQAGSKNFDAMEFFLREAGRG